MSRRPNEWEWYERKRKQEAALWVLLIIAIITFIIAC